MKKKKKDNVYVIEKILKKRLRDGKVSEKNGARKQPKVTDFCFQTEYLLKWKDYDDSDNTWEPEENLIDIKMVKAFEKTLQQNKTPTEPETGRKASNYHLRLNSYPLIIVAATSPSTSSAEASGTPDFNTSNVAFGFSRGLIPEKIVGATNVSGNLMFLIKWTNEEEADLVSSEVANKECPQLVIKFYEARLKFP